MPEKKKNQKEVNPGWPKSYIILCSIISVLLLFYFYALGIPLYFLPIVLVIIILLFLINGLFKLHFQAKLIHFFSFLTTKVLFEKKLEIGEIEKRGEVLYSWTKTDGEVALRLVLHYKHPALTLFFCFPFTFLLILLLLLDISVLISFLASFIISLVLTSSLILALWISSKFRFQTVSYKILAEGIYIRKNYFSEGLNGLFTPFSKLEYPRFDNENKFIVFRFKNKKFLRRFLVCTPENYKSVSEYLESISYKK